MKRSLLLSTLLFCVGLQSQIINTAPYILTVDELKQWTETGPTASTDLISTVPLAARFINTETQFNPALNNNMQIAYLPDGMNNFGNYYGEQSQFNLYNFTHWAYLDKLVWFGGTSSQSVQVPSSPWANAAHKNGVKIFGNVFFAPTAFGGSTATLQNFLEQDIDGNFIAIPKMIAIMEYYKFDGWFINQETATNPTVAGLMYEFVRDLTAAAEAIGKEVMWYDAMILSGNVGWQNRLNGSNSPFVQNDENGNAADGYEQRVSSSIFINFFWGSSSLPSLSRTRAATIGRSSYEVFTGADIWPNRNQGDFQTNGNTFMGYLHENATTPYTSLGLFAPNCIYNNSLYTNFNNDPADYASFYNAENRMFGGADGNPAIIDVIGFKGFCNWIPETSVLTGAFQTDFSTGHGTQKFEQGISVSSESWHNMNEQDFLPTWQWAFTPDSGLSAAWDFDDAYNGGNSLKITGSLATNTPVDLMLFKTKIPISFDMGVVSDLLIVYKETISLEVDMKLLLVFSDEPSQKYELTITEAGNVWVNGSASTVDFLGREVAMIGLRFESGTSVSNYSVNIGSLELIPTVLNVNDPMITQNSVTVAYSQMNQIDFTIKWPGATKINFCVFDMQGRKIASDEIALKQSVKYVFDAESFSSGTYIVKFSDGNNVTETKKIIIK